MDISTSDLIGSMDSSYLGNPEWPDRDGVEFDPDHEGHWGWTTADLVGALPGWLADYTPDVALIHAGTNDAYSDLPTADSVANLTEIIELLRDDNPSVAVLLAQLIPTDDAVANALIDDLNAELTGVVAELHTADAPLLLVDQNTGFELSQHSDDGIHPNAAGELLLAERWIAALALLE